MDTITMIKAMGIEVNWVSYKSQERNTDLAGGHIDASADFMGTLKSYVDAKTIRPLAVAAPKRVDLFSDIPTFREEGFELGDYPYWEGIFAPKGTPPEILKILEAALQKSLADPAAIEQFRKILKVPQFLPGAEFAKLIANEDERIKGLVKDYNLGPAK